MYERQSALLVFVLLTWSLYVCVCLSVCVSHEQVPEVDTAVRSVTVAADGSLAVAANNNGTCYVWRLFKGSQVYICAVFAFISVVFFFLTKWT